MGFGKIPTGRFDPQGPNSGLDTGTDIEAC